MKLIWMCVLATFLMTSLRCCIAETYTAKTGPFTIQVTSQEAVDFSINTSLPLYDNFNAYDVDVYIGDSGFAIEE